MPAKPTEPRLWFRAALVDGAAHRIISSEPARPAPKGLLFEHLRSYLERRFGQPVAEPEPLANAIVFRPLDSIETRTPASHVLVVAPQVQAVNGSLNPLCEALRTNEVLRRLLGYAPGESIYALRAIWTGHLHDHAFLLRWANDSAAMASRASLLTLGWDLQLHSLLNSPGSPKVAAPDVASKVDEATRLAGEAAQAADAAAAAFSKFPVDEDALARAAEAAHVARSRCDHGLRTLAQLGLGIAAAYPGSPQVERVDRAGTALLAPPEDLERVALCDDGLTADSRDFEEFEVELAGLISRILLDRVSVLRLCRHGSGDVWLDIGVVDDDVLRVSVEGPGFDRVREALRAAGWASRDDRGEAIRLYPSPVRTLVAAREAIALLKSGLGVSGIAELEGTTWDRRV